MNSGTNSGRLSRHKGRDWFDESSGRRDLGEKIVRGHSLRIRSELLGGDMLGQREASRIRIMGAMTAESPIFGRSVEIRSPSMPCKRLFGARRDTGGAREIRS
jgi:hypothetical protein